MRAVLVVLVVCLGLAAASGVSLDGPSGSLQPASCVRPSGGRSRSSRFTVRPVIDPTLTLDPQLAQNSSIRVRKSNLRLTRFHTGPATDRLSSNETRGKFTRFKNRHRRQYASATKENDAYTKFKANRARIVELNNLHRTQELHSEKPLFSSEGPFAAMSPEEFARTRLANGPITIPADVENGTLLLEESSDSALFLETELEALAADALTVDWRSKSTPIRDQGTCGGCWAFAAVATAESWLAIRSGGAPTPLSPQWLLSCGGGFNANLRGCTQGVSSMGLQFLGRQGPNLFTERDYPFRGAGVTCPANKATPKQGWFTQAYTNLREQALLDALKRGPISVNVDARAWQHYNGGIFPSRACSNAGAAMRHSVVLVGFGVEKGVQYWLIRNSWGSSWGEGGYIRVESGLGACGIGNLVSFPVFQ